MLWHHERHRITHCVRVLQHCTHSVVKLLSKCLQRTQCVMRCRSRCQAVPVHWLMLATSIYTKHGQMQMTKQLWRTTLQLILPSTVVDPSKKVLAAAVSVAWGPSSSADVTVQRVRRRLQMSRLDSTRLKSTPFLPELKCHDSLNGHRQHASRNNRVQLGHAVLEISSQTDRRTHRHTRSLQYSAILPTAVQLTCCPVWRYFSVSFAGDVAATTHRSRGADSVRKPGKSLRAEATWKLYIFRKYVTHRYAAEEWPSHGHGNMHNIL